MKNKKEIAGIITFFIIVIVLSAVGTVFYFGVRQETLPVGCIIQESGYETDGNVFCNFQNCEVWVDDVCNLEDTINRVIFRTNAVNSLDLAPPNNPFNLWFAIDIDGNGVLESYGRGNCPSGGNNNFLLNYKDVDIRGPGINGNLIVRQKGAEFGGLLYCLTEGGETSSFPTEPYTSNGQEIYGGSIYHCDVDFNKGVDLLEFLEYNGNSPGAIQSSIYIIDEGESVSAIRGSEKYRIGYNKCGPCGDCIIGEKSCKDSITITECIADGEGCGFITEVTAPINKICIDEEFVLCDDGNVCTNDLRPIENTECFFSPTENCCGVLTDCEDNNICTADSCINNLCYNTEIPTCCTPSCDENNICINQVCELKEGCRYNTDECNLPQTCDIFANEGRGECICPIGGNFCEKEEYLGTFCFNQEVWICDVDSTGLCYEKRLKDECGEGVFGATPVCRDN